MSSQTLTTGFLTDAAGPGSHGERMRAVPRRGRRGPRRVGTWAMVVAAYRRHRMRVVLAGLNADMLKDIGVSFAEAEHEANKPFWRM